METILVLFCFCTSAFASDGERCPQTSESWETQMDRGDILAACRKVGFSTNADFQECIRNGRSEEGIGLCLWAFNKFKDILECISNLDPKDPKIVSACHKPFSYLWHVSSCIKDSRNLRVIRDCTEAYEYQRDVLTCATGKPSYRKNLSKIRLRGKVPFL